MDTKQFKMGWLMVAFDLPVTTKAGRKSATNFRKFLLDDGYQMMQFSVYVRPCVTAARRPTSGESRRLSLRRVRFEPSILPERSGSARG